MKLRSTILVVIVCCLATFSTLRAEAPLAEQLPAGSLAYVGWAGRSLPFDGSHLGQLLQEPAVANMIGALNQSIENMPDKNVAHLWAIGGIVWQHPVAISLMDLKAGPNGAPGVSMVLMIDLGKDRPAFAKHLEALIQSGNLRLNQATIGQVACRTTGSPLGAITLGYKGNTFFLTLGDQTARKLLSVKPATSLKADKAFIARRKGVSGDAEQFAYSVDLATLLPKATALFNGAPRDGGRTGKAPATDKVTLIINALGLGKITSASGSTRIVDKGLHTKTRILTPAPHRGVLKLFTGGKLSDADLADAPDDSILFCATKFSASAFYAELLEVAKRIEPGAEKKIISAVAQMGDELGISLPKDILANLGDTWTLTSASSLGGLGTGTVLTVSVKDSAKLGAAIGKIEALIRKNTESPPPRGARVMRARGPRIQVLKSGKLEVHYLQGIDRDAPIAPAWAVHKNKLYIALWPQVVVAAVENSGKSPLVHKAAFKKLRARMSKAPATLTYIDTPSIVRSAYNLMLLGWTVGAAELPRELGFQAYPKVDWLPSLSKIEKYLSPEAAAISYDAKGVTIESYGSLPVISNMMTSVVTTSSVSAALLIPAVSRAKAGAQQASARANLSGIGRAVAMYQAENGKIPPSLITLVEKKLLTAQSLRSPTTGRPMLVDAKGLPMEKSDYVYIVHNANAPGNLIRAYELPMNYEERGTNILLVSGAVMWVDMPTFKRMLAKSGQQLAPRS